MVQYFIRHSAHESTAGWQLPLPTAASPNCSLAPGSCDPQQTPLPFRGIHSAVSCGEHPRPGGRASARCTAGPTATPAANGLHAERWPISAQPPPGCLHRQVASQPCWPCSHSAGLLACFRFAAITNETSRSATIGPASTLWSRPAQTRSRALPSPPMPSVGSTGTRCRSAGLGTACAPAARCAAVQWGSCAAW